jgi:hypothetical protein
VSHILVFPFSPVFVLLRFAGEIVVFSLADFSVVCRIALHKKRFVCCLSGRANLLASVDEQRLVALHNAQTCECVFSMSFDVAVTAVAFVPDNNWLSVAVLSDQIFIVDYIKKQHTPWSSMVCSLFS